MNQNSHKRKKAPQEIGGSIEKYAYSNNSNKVTLNFTIDNDSYI